MWWRVWHIPPDCQTRRIGNLRAQCLFHIVRRSGQQRRVENTRQNRVDANTSRDKSRAMGRVIPTPPLEPNTRPARFARLQRQQMPYLPWLRGRRIPAGRASSCLRLIWRYTERADQIDLDNQIERIRGKCEISPVSLFRDAVLMALPVPAQLIRMRS